MQMNFVEISSIFCQILGPLVLGWAPNHFILGAQLATGEKNISLYPCTLYALMDSSGLKQ